MTVITEYGKQNIFAKEPPIEIMNQNEENFLMEQAERRKKLIAEEEKKIAEKEDKLKKHINKEYEGEIAEKLLKKAKMVFSKLIQI